MILKFLGPAFLPYYNKFFHIFSEYDNLSGMEINEALHWFANEFRMKNKDYIVATKKISDYMETVHSLTT